MIRSASGTASTPAVADPATVPQGGFVDVWIYAVITAASPIGTLIVTLIWSDEVQQQTKTYAVPMALKGDFLNAREPIYCAPGSQVKVSAAAVGASSALAYDLHTLVM